MGKSLALAFLSALLLVLAFPPWNLSFLIWVALVPWFLALDRVQTWKQALGLGFWLSFWMNLGGFSWVAYALKNYGKLPWVVAILGMLVFGLACQPQFPLFAVARRWILSLHPRVGRGALSLTLASVYTAIDWLLPKLWVDTLGHAFYRSSWLLQAADLGGPFLLTFAAVWVNHTFYTVARGLLTRGEPSIWPTLRAERWDLVGTLSLVAALLGYGAWRLENMQARVAAPERTVRMSVIQANIGDIEKLAAEQGLGAAADGVVSKYIAMSRDALALSPKPDFIVWPETAYPSVFRQPMGPKELARDQWVEEFVESTRTPLLFGGYDHEGGKDFNAFFFLSPENRFAAYRKNVLLLFGEYIPGSETFTFIKNAFPQVGNFGRGPGPQVFDLEGASGARLRFGPLICYEILFPNFVIGAAHQGSQLILNVTNDSWFGPWGEPDLHFALSVFRGVETRLPQLRATNTGYTALIQADGSVVEQSKLFEPAVLTYDIPLYDREVWTLMKAWGDWFGWFALGVSALSLATPLAGAIRRRFA